MYANGKMRPIETVTGMGEENKGEWGGSEFKYDIFDIL
jgi:hypothetical protein